MEKANFKGFFTIAGIMSTLMLTISGYLATANEYANTKRAELTTELENMQKPEVIQKVLDQLIPPDTSNPQSTQTNNLLENPNIKIVTYKEGFLNEKVKEYLTASQPYIKFKVSNVKVILNDGFADFLINSDDNKSVTGKLKVAESGKNLTLYDLELNNFGSASVVTKLAIQNIFNLRKDLIAMTYHDDLEKIEIKKGEVLIYLSN
jgi:hypothetical protein